MGNLDRIDNFLTGKMSSAEAERFKQEMNRDEELAHEVDMHRLELTAISLLAKDDLYAKMKATLEEDRPFEKIRARKQASKRIISIVAIAVAIFLLLLTVFLLRNDGHPDPHIASNKIVEEGYKLVPPDISTERGDNQYVKILNNQDQDRAKDAIDYFDSLFINNSDFSDSLTLTLNLAHAYMLNRNYNEAITLFNQIESSEKTNELLKEKILYYKALALIGKGEMKNAISVLEQLIATDTKYKNPSQQILSKIIPEG